MSYYSISFSVTPGLVGSPYYVSRIKIPDNRNDKVVNKIGHYFYIDQ